MSLLYVMLVIPIIGIFCISTLHSFYPITVNKVKSVNNIEYSLTNTFPSKNSILNDKKDSCFVAMDSAAVNFYKKIAFIATILNLIVSLIIYMTFDFSNNQFQFIQENFDLSFYDIYLGVDGLSIYFILLTTIIMPIALVSNWNSIVNNIKSYLIIMLLLETLLLAVFLVLDVLLFYIFFESILPPGWIFGKYSWRDLLPNSGEPLKLKVPSNIRKDIGGWINLSGMVITLKMRENKMGYRGSKLVLGNTVKEQRVYGSIIGTLLSSPMLRCTLMGFERNSQVRILSNQLNNLRSYSTANSRVANSQIGGYLLKPYFVTGFTDAEGSFIVRIRKNPKAKIGWSVETKFSICIHKKDIMVLELIKLFLVELVALLTQVNTLFIIE